MAEEKSRKELLEEPDPFMVFVGKVMTFAKTYQQQIIMAAIALVLVAAVISGMVYFRQKSEDRAAALFGTAVVKYHGIMQSNSSPDFAAYEEVKADFRAVIDQYGSTGAGRAALIKYADICFEMKQYDETIDAYQKALAAFKDQDDFTGLINNGLAYAYEARGDMDEAEKYFNRVLADPHAVAKDHVLFNLARIHEKQGRTDHRAEALKRLVTEYPESIFYQPAKEKMFVPASAEAESAGVPIPTAGGKVPVAIVSEQPKEATAPATQPVEDEGIEISESPESETSEAASPPVEAEGAVAPESGADAPQSPEPEEQGS